MSQHKLSLPTAIIINMNIMLGAGLFVNTISLAKLAGILSPFAYIAVGLLMLPLVMSMAELLKIHPGGSFYTFGNKEVGPLAGFMGAWSYFIGKLASCTLMVHFATLIIQNTFPILKCINILWLDLFVIAVFTALNLLNMRTGSKIQFTFMFLKIMPILFIIFSGLIFFDLANIDTNVNWGGILFSMPLVVYAFAGFEASCSLSAHIKNPQKNAPIATLVSFFLVIALSFAYQLMFYGMIGSDLGTLSHYFEIFPAVLHKVIPAGGAFADKLQAIMQLAIALSSMGGAYGILFSNSWNLHTLAKHNHLPGSNIIGRLNKHGIPEISIATEALICITYILVTQGNNIPLQQIGAFGCTLAYTFCVLSLLANALRQPTRKALALPIFGVLSCTTLLASCINGFIKNGTYSPIAFFILLGAGIIMFYYKKYDCEDAIAS